MAVTPLISGDALLAAAGRGDADAFRELVEPHRAELHAHCYRMLGSLYDAEDALQDALLRAWRGIHGVRRREALRAWLYRIATNSALDVAARRPVRTMPINDGRAADPRDEVGEPLVERAWLEPYPDAMVGLQDGRATPDARYEQREAVELAFVAALQHLPPRQRAALILREVLGYSAQEIADTLATTVAAANSALQRARRTLDERLPARSQQATVRTLGDARARRLADEFMDAWQRADVDALATLLAEDATLSMPPHREWYRGRDALVALAVHTKPLCPECRWLPIRANGQPALACYLADPAEGAFVATSISIVDFAGAQVAGFTSFVFAELFARFGLPYRLAATS